MWDLAADKQMMHEEQPLQVARCTKIIANGESEDDSMYMINVKQIAKFVVGLGEKVAPADIEEVHFRLAPAAHHFPFVWSVPTS